MKVSRRDLLVWSAGAAAGLIVTPVPWKLLDDTSIWSQNWPWIPQPARGPVEVKQSSCTLCPNGCSIRVRTAAGWPVGVAGVASHPISRGALCPLGFGAHQLNWHPQRLRTVRHGATSSSWTEARAAFAKACGEGPVAVIDGYPGRASSQVLETFAEKHAGCYETLSGVPASALGYDLENAQSIVSFAAPLLDGWGTPGRFTHLWADRAAGMADPQLRLIQIEPTLSRTATRAWKWVPVNGGAETALAAGLARVLVEEHLVPAGGPIPPLTLSEAAAQTGLTPDAIRDLARTIAARTPAVAIANDDNPAIAALNIVLGAVGARGGIVRNFVRKSGSQPKTVRPLTSADAALPKLRAILIDSSVPWDFVPPTDAEVFRFAAWDGGKLNGRETDGAASKGASKAADWLLPAPGFLEELTDVPSAPALAVETYAVAPSLVKSPHETQSAAGLLNSIDPALPTTEQIIHTRCADLFRERAGTLHAREVTPVAKLASAQKLEEHLSTGAVWIGEPVHPEHFRCELKAWPAPIAATPTETWTSAWTAPVLPPLATKLYQESSLREPPASTRRNA